MPDNAQLLQELIKISATVNRMEGRQDEGMLLLESLTRELREGMKSADERLDALTGRVTTVEAHLAKLCPKHDKSIEELALRFERHIEEHGKTAVERAGKDGEARGEKRIKARAVAVMVTGASAAGGLIATYWRELLALAMGVGNGK